MLSHFGLIKQFLIKILRKLLKDTGSCMYFRGFIFLVLDCLIFWDNSLSVFEWCWLTELVDVITNRVIPGQRSTTLWLGACFYIFILIFILKFTARRQSCAFKWLFSKRFYIIFLNWCPVLVLKFQV